MAGILKVDQVQSDSNLAFAIAGSNVAYMNSTGLQMTGSTLSLGGTTIIPAVGQIKFPATQNASSDGNTLDDYEEGTWTPTIGSGSGTITTSSFSGAKYTKIGNVVEATVNITITTVGSAGGGCTFTLPFTGTDAVQICGYGMETNTNGAMLKGFLPSSSATVQITMYNNTSPFSMGSGSVFVMTVVYQV